MKTTAKMASRADLMRLARDPKIRAIFVKMAEPLVQDKYRDCGVWEDGFNPMFDFEPLSAADIAENEGPEWIDIVARKHSGFRDALEQVAMSIAEQISPYATVADGMGELRDDEEHLQELFLQHVAPFEARDFDSVFEDLKSDCLDRRSMRRNPSGFFGVGRHAAQEKVASPETVVRLWLGRK